MHKTRSSRIASAGTGISAIATAARAVALVALACTSAGAARAATVSLTPASQHVAVGDTVVVDITVSGLGAEVLSAMDLNLFWNGAVIGASQRALDASTAAEQLGLGLGVAPVSAVGASALGEFELQMVALVDDAALSAFQADSFLIARLSFSADADGVTLLQFGADPDFERNFIGLNASPLQVDLGSACVGVGTGQCGGTAPEPSAAWLAAAALAAVAWPWRRRR